jgi:hypothetical protein
MQRWKHLLVCASAWFAPALFALDFPERDEWLRWMQPITPLGYVVRRAETAIGIDGRIDEKSWAAAPWTSDFVDIEGAAKPPPRFRTRAKMLWDDRYLYIAAEMEEPHVWATLKEHDSVIFRDPDFEVFIDPDGDTHGYSEFEMNAFNTGWDLLLPKPYQDGGPPDNSWELRGLRTAVHVQGTLNDASDRDRGWSVEIAIPWTALEMHARHAGPPREGEQWRINFSRVEWKIDTGDGTYRKIPDTPEDNWVWSPQGVIDMHRPEMWGLLQFTREPPSTAIAVAPIPGKSARDFALAVYYAQRDFSKAQGRCATTLEELGLAPPGPNRSAAGKSAVTKASLEAVNDGYECRVEYTDAAGKLRGWSIRQDRKLQWLESPPRPPK